MSPLLPACGLAGAVALLLDWWWQPGRRLVLHLPRTPIAGLADRLQRAGWQHLSSGGFFLLSAGLGALAALVVQWSLGYPVVSAAAGILGAGLLWAALGFAEQRRQRELDDALADALRFLRDALRSGSSLSEGMTLLARTGPPRLRAEFGRSTQQAVLDGWTPALRTLRCRLASPLGDLMVGALLLHEQHASTRLGDLLDRLNHAAREQARVRREAAAVQAGQRLTAGLVAGAPWLLLLLLHGINPDYLNFFQQRLGEALLLLGLLIDAAAVLGSLQLGRLPAEPRILLGRREETS